MKTINQIIKTLEDHKQELREKFGVLSIGVFGSFARGEETEDSDIDIYVEFDLERLTFSKYLELLEYLEKLLDIKVDLITKDGLESIRIPYIKAEIEKDLIYV